MCLNVSEDMLLPAQHAREKTLADSARNVKALIMSVTGNPFRPLFLPASPLSILLFALSLAKFTNGLDANIIRGQDPVRLGR